MEIKISELKTVCSLEVKYKEETKKVEVDSPEPLEINLLLQYNAEIISLTGSIEGKIYLICSRCLETYLHPIKIKVNQKIPLEEIGANEILDLTEEIRQQIILNLPDKPLCAKNCQGLCPECGENLNLKECNCSNRVADAQETYTLLKKLI